MYFKFFPEFTYTLRNRDYSFADIFRRVAFSTQSLQNQKLFIENYVIDGETLESIAQKYYNDPSLGWLILLANNLTSFEEFPMSEGELNRIANNKFSGNSYFFNEYMPDLRVGDVAIKVTIVNNEVSTIDNSNYGVIKEYNSLMRYVWIKSLTGTLSANDYVVFKRLAGNEVIDVPHVQYTNATPTSVTKSYAQIKKVTTNQLSPEVFIDSNGNYVSGYYIDSSYEAKSSALGYYATATLSDTNTIYNTLLYDFINSTGTTTYRTKLDQYISDNSSRRIIKILKPQYVGQVFFAIQELVTSNDQRTLNLVLEE
jgi:hypothetical protein